MFEFVEVAFDEVALPVDVAVDGALNLSVSLGGDMGLGSTRRDPLDKCHCVMALGDDDVGCAVQAVKQRKSGGLVRMFNPPI